MVQVWLQACAPFSFCCILLFPMFSCSLLLPAGHQTHLSLSKLIPHSVMCRCPPPSASPVHPSLQVKVADDSSTAQPAGTADISRWMANAGRHQHQSILPWFWDVLSSEDLQRAPGG
jgi:hypothetical protein